MRKIKFQIITSHGYRETKVIFEQGLAHMTQKNNIIYIFTYMYICIYVYTVLANS